MDEALGGRGLAASSPKPRWQLTGRLGAAHHSPQAN